MEHHAALVIKHDNKFLFIQRAFTKKTLPGAWSFPSGTVEPKESINETAVREAEEELGIEVEPVSTFAEKELSEFSVFLHFVLCNIKSGKPSIRDSNEIRKIEFMTFSEFFNKFSDEEVGHGLVWLRKNPRIFMNV